MHWLSSRFALTKWNCLAEEQEKLIRRTCLALHKKSAHVIFGTQYRSHCLKGCMLRRSENNRTSSNYGLSSRVCTGVCHLIQKKTINIFFTSWYTFFNCQTDNLHFKWSYRNYGIRLLINSGVDENKNKDICLYSNVCGMLFLVPGVRVWFRSWPLPELKETC